MKTIKEKNRMIAEFMGVTPNEFGVYDFGNEQKYSELQYHKSWDWLMPVIKEISNKTGYVYVMYGTDSYFTNMGDSFYFGGGFESIEETHIAVVQFIEWYNQNK